MDSVFEIEGYTIDTVYTEREVNFVVSNREGYLFRLVPGLAGFRISALDRALNADINLTLAQQIGNSIDNYFS